MKKTLLALITIAFLFQNSSFGNNNDISEGWCGTKAPDDNWEHAFQREVANYMLNHYSGRNSSVPISIPIIVHVVYYSNTSAQNISKAQIDSQIVVLNRDYSGTSFYYNNIPAAFKPLVANTNITWCPAKVSKNGTLLPEYGIDRVDGRSLGFPNPNLTGGWSKAYIDETVKPATIWNPDYYCNIWIVPRMQDGIIGYATFPTNTTLDGLGGGNATSKTDGVVIAAFAYGKGGSTVAPYNQGGTAAHELGHWLGLRHISGDEACGNDYCGDTPPQSGGNSGGQNGLNYGCATYPYHANGCSGTTGPNGEMYMNYMDYSDDNCTSMFTNDQKTRMQTSLSFGDRRLTLLSSTMCDTVIPAPVADFISTLQNTALCASIRSFTFTDKTIFGATTWSWSFSGGTPATSTLKNPTGIVFNTAGLHTVSLTATSPRGTSTISKEINVPIIGTATLPLQEDFEGNDFPPVGWNYVNRNGNMNINWDLMVGISARGIGNQCMRFDNTSLDARGFDDDIVTPKLDFTGISSSKLKFDVAYAPYFSGTTSIFDTLEVYITDNCESTVQRIYTKGGTALATSLPGIGSEFYPTATEWRTDSVAIPANYLNKPNVQVIFRNLGNFGHTIYVDNVNISIPASAPTASFTSSSTAVCQNSSITFTNTSTGSPDSVRWTINGGSPSTSTSSTTVSSTFNTAGTFTVSLVVYKSGTMYGPFTQSITVNAKPTVVANGLAICSGNSASVSASGASTYSWNTGATGYTLTVSPAATTTYTVTGTGSNGCINTDTAIVTVNAKPTVGITNSTPTICANASASLTGTGASTYSWNTGATTAGITVFPTTTTTYTVTGTTNGCSNTATSTVTVKPLPTVTVNNPTICAGSSVTLTAGGATTYSWNTGATTNTITVSPTTTTTYTVTGTTNGCTSAVNATVNVNSTTPTVTLNNNTVSVCNGTSVTLSASGADNYTWSTGASGNSITFTPTINGTVSVSGTLTGCSTPGTATASITVKPNPTVAIDNSSSPICAGSSATLGGTGADSYVWNTGATTNSISVSPTTTTTYSVTGTTNGCIGTASTTVVVNALPNTAIGASAASICSGQSSTLTGSGANSYTWNTGATTNSISVSPTTTTTYTLTGTSNGCSKTATQTVSVNATPAQATITQNTGRDTLYCSTVVAGATYNWYLNGSTTPIVTSTPWIKITQSGSYTVEVISSGCTSALSNAFAGIYTAIRVNSNTIRAWEVYPNPTDGRLLLNLSLVKQAEVNISIYNAVGSEVYVKSYGNVKDINDEVRLDDLAKGVYIIKMNVDNEIFYHKVVKN